VSFVDLYEGIRERVLEGRGLPAQDMYQLVESVKSAEQAVRCLDLIQRQLDNKAMAMQAATMDSSEAAAGAAAAMTRPPAPPGSMPGTRPSLFGSDPAAGPPAAAAGPSSSSPTPPPGASANPYANIRPATSTSSSAQANPYANLRPASSTSGAVGSSLAGGTIPQATSRFVNQPSNFPSSPVPGAASPTSPYPSSPVPGAGRVPPPQGMMPQPPPPGAAPAAAVAAPPMPTPLGAPLPSKQELSRFLSDWHFRKRYLMRLCVISVMELRKPEVMYRIVGSMGAYKISTYFAKELIFELGRRGAQMNELMTAAQLTTQQRGYKDKGSRSAWFAVLSLMKERGMGRDEMLPVFQALNQPPSTPPPTAQQQTQQQAREPQPAGARA